MNGAEAQADPDSTDGQGANRSPATDARLHAGGGARPLAGDAPLHPPGLDAPGKGRFRWRYTLWYTWPRKPPTQQDLRDFVFTTWATIVGGSVAGITAVLLVTDAPWPLIAIAVTGGLVLAALLGWPYVAMGKRDWRRRQA